MGSNDKTLQAFQALQAQHEMLVEQHEQVSKQNKQMSKQNERMRKQLAFEDSLWQSEENKTKRVVRGGTPLRMHAIEVADGIIGDPVRLCNVTGCTKESFTIILERFTEEVMDDEDRPLFWEDDVRGGDAGNRCKLYIRHALLAVLMSIRTKATQHHLAATFDVDQSTMSRYLRYGAVLLRRLLPASEKLASIICKTPAGKLEEVLIPKKTLLIDGTLTPVDRPGDRTARKTRYSGRKKRHMFNTIITSNLDGLILHCGKTVDGSVNDKGVMNAGGGPDFGRHTGSMRNAKNADDPEEAFVIYSDLGFEGIQKMLPGAIHRQPPKKPRDGDLTATQKRRRKQISRVRVRVEHHIGRLKRYGILTMPFGGTAKDLNYFMQIITGLENLKTMLKRKKYYGQLLQQLHLLPDT